MKTVKDILNSQQLHGLLKSPETEQPETSAETKRKSQYKLYAIFKVAAPHSSWNWDPLWLMDYYKKKEGLLFAGQWDAIQYKIDEIVDRCKIIMVYDNRETAAHQVIFKIRNGIIIINNLHINNPYEIGRKWLLILDIRSIPRG